MKLLRIAGAVLGMLFAPLASVAVAAPLFYHFNVGFASGPLAGNVDPGLITVDGNDCPGNICNGLFSPGDVAHTLLGLDITVRGIAFTASSDTGFPGFPHAPGVHRWHLSAQFALGWRLQPSVIASRGSARSSRCGGGSRGRSAGWGDRSRPSRPPRRSLA